MELIKDLGMKFPNLNSSQKRRFGLFKCECGTVEEKQTALVKSKHTQYCKSCGQKRTGKKHGGKGTRIYNTWQGMKQRCLNSNNPQYKWYGGKGITIYKEWVNDFQAFREWSYSAGYSTHLTIERKKSELNYTPDNCEWIPLVNNISNSGKLSKEHKIEIIQKYKSGDYKQVDLADEYGITQSSVSWLTRYSLYYEDKEK